MAAALIAEREAQFEMPGQVRAELQGGHAAAAGDAYRAFGDQNVAYGRVAARFEGRLQQWRVQQPEERLHNLAELLQRADAAAETAKTRAGQEPEGTP